MLALVAVPSAQAASICTPETVYSVYSNTPNDMVVYDRAGVWNGTAAYTTGTFTADTGGTVSATAGISLSAEASAAVFAKVSATVNASVTRTMTASIGFSAASPVKPYSTLKGDYGIQRENVTMKRYYIQSNCATTTPTYFSYYAPYRRLWHLYY